MPRIIPTKETIFLLKTIALVDDLPDWGGDFVFESKNFLDAGLVFASDIELSEILGVFRILSLVFVVNLSNEIISEYSLERHFLLAKRTVFVENSKEDAEGEESIEKNIDRIVEDWLVFALEGVPNVPGGTKNINWLYNNRSNRNVIGNGSDDPDEAMRDGENLFVVNLIKKVGRESGTGNFASQDDILDSLNKVFGDIHLVNHARRNYKKRIQDRINAASSRSRNEDRTLLLNKAEIGDEDDPINFNVADIYCLDKFIDKFFEDSRNKVEIVINGSFNGFNLLSKKDKIISSDTIVDPATEERTLKGMEREKNDPDPEGDDGGPGRGDEFAYQFQITEVDRLAGNNNAGDEIIEDYCEKSLTGTQAALAFACGIDHDDIRRDGTFTTDATSYDLKTPVGLRNAVRSKSLEINPTIGEEEQEIFAEATILDTAAAEHHAALLLAYLRAAKNNQPLNLDTDGIPDLTGSHDSANAEAIKFYFEVPEELDGLGRTKINNPVHLARQALNNAFNNIVDRVHARYEELRNAEFVNQFKRQRIFANRIDNN
ncbi:20235_t:CDS:2 [Entrophospora sp. SA101]|nr:20235_t:CDS:2 [Entrophospora sp. SA101]